MSRVPEPRPAGVPYRIGLIVPSLNATIEPDLYRVSPANFTYHSTRVLLRETTPDELRLMNEHLVEAAGLMKTLRPDLLVYACTSGSFIDGWDALDSQMHALSVAVSRPVIATSQAAVDAIEHLGIRRLALATPYVPVVTALESVFLEQRGLQVVSVRELGLSGEEIRDVPVGAVFDLALAADCAEADAVFISCTDLAAMEIIQTLEDRLAKPVLTSNQVTLWAILRSCGWTGAVEGHGQLLADVGAA